MEDTTLNPTDQQIIGVLHDRLKEVDRGPKGLLDAWRNAAGDDQTGAIFRESGGFFAWLGYFLTKNAATVRYHFNGKAACARLIPVLEEKSVDYRQSLAKHLVATISDETRLNIDRLYNARIMQGQNKRQRKYSSADGIAF